MGLLMENILVIDDDRELCKLLTEYLKPEGFQVEIAHDGETGIKMALNKKYSLMILGVMLPGRNNGFSVLQHFRSRASTPIFVLLARPDEGDRITVLEMGADDCLPKPFNPRELVARIRAVLRRTRREGEHRTLPPISQKLRVGDIEMDIGTHVVLRSGKKIALTSVEFCLLEALLRNAGQLVSREELMKGVLGRSLSAYDRSIDVHVSKLRKKLGYEIPGMERIKTIRSVGYLYTLTSAPENASVT
jgi:two-component system response regulator CpxR